MVEIVVGIVQDGERILFLRRANKPFQGMLAFIGGKVMDGEDRESALVREIEQEAGLEVEEAVRVGFYQETVLDVGQTYQHLIHIYLVIPESLDSLRGSEEGEPEFLRLDEIDKHKEEIVPSDYRMVERIFYNNERGFQGKIVLENRGGKYEVYSETELERV